MSPIGGTPEPAATIAVPPPPPVARRRTHRKSRHGCSYCKGRRIKCDELRPACSNCVIRGLVCSLSTAAAVAADGSGSGSDANGSLPGSCDTGSLPGIPEVSSVFSASPLTHQQRRQLPLPPLPPTTPRSPLSKRPTAVFPLNLATRNLGTLAMAATSPRAALEPPPVSSSPMPAATQAQLLPPESPYPPASYTNISTGLPMMTGGLDYEDLHLLHHFVTFTDKTFGHSHIIQRFWSVTAPEVGFQHHFVLHAILAVSGLHLAQLSPSDPVKREQLRRKVNHHWDVSLRLATPLLSDLNADNCDALHVFTGLTCIYIFARGPQPGSYLLFDVENPLEGGMNAAKTETLAVNGGGGPAEEGCTVAAAAAKGISTTEEWLVFFRGLRSVMKAAETARRARKASTSSSSVYEEQQQPWGLMDQMFGPDDSLAEEELADDCWDGDHQMSEASEETTRAGGSSGGGGDSERRYSHASGSQRPALAPPRHRLRDPLDGAFANRSQPMRDLRDLIRQHQQQQARAGDDSGDADVYASAFGELAASYATVFEKDMSTRQTSAQVVFGWMYHISDEFIERVRARQPVALAIFAHFVVLLSVLELKWMTRGWPEHLLSGIYETIGPAGRLWIRWPMERVGWLPG